MMSEFLEELLCYSENSLHTFSEVKKTSEKAEMNKRRLKQNLSKKQKALFLRYEDEKDLIIDRASAESYVAGFKLGLKIGYEVNKD